MIKSTTHLTSSDRSNPILYTLNYVLDYIVSTDGKRYKNDEFVMLFSIVTVLVINKVFL